MRKYIFAQESFYLQGIFNDINEQDTSFLDCKHKHMMKCGAPPDKFRVHVPYVYLWNSMVSKAELILRVIALWFLVLSQFFIDGMGPFKFLVKQWSDVFLKSSNFARNSTSFKVFL